MALSEEFRQIEFIGSAADTDSEIKILGRKPSTYERFLTQIEGITSAKIVSDKRGRILECHILADDSRHVKQLVRDVQSALMAKYSLDIDYKCISIAQVGKSESKYSKTVDSRVKISSLSITYSEKNVGANVTLGYKGKLYEGYFEGSSSTTSILASVARATVISINKMLGNENGYSLLDATQLNLGGCPVCVVAIRTNDNKLDETLVGSAVIRDDMNRTMVRAVLDAVNRNISLMLGDVGKTV